MEQTQKKNTKTFQEFTEFFNGLDPELCNKLHGIETPADMKILCWAKLRFLRWLWNKPQRQNIDFIEASIIKQVREQGFSFDEIAFVVDRSKSSVYEYAKSQGLE